MDRLDDFGYNRKVTTCRRCSHDFKRGVEEAVKTVRKYSDGLCLDCMNDSEESARNKGRAMRDPYWNRKHIGDWSGGCRVTHNEPTWYYSNFARKQEE